MSYMFYCMYVHTHCINDETCLLWSHLILEDSGLSPAVPLSEICTYCMYCVVRVICTYCTVYTMLYM